MKIFHPPVKAEQTLPLRMLLNLKYLFKSFWSSIKLFSAKQEKQSRADFFFHFFGFACHPHSNIQIYTHSEAENDEEIFHFSDAFSAIWGKKLFI